MGYLLHYSLLILADYIAKTILPSFNFNTNLLAII